MNMREDAIKIVNEAIQAVYPENTVKKALENFGSAGNVKVLAIGKAAWRMAKAARESLESHISEGIIITKYKHSMG